MYWLRNTFHAQFKAHDINDDDHFHLFLIKYKCSNNPALKRDHETPAESALQTWLVISCRLGSRWRCRGEDSDESGPDPIQNHDNTEQPRIYSRELKDIVQGRQSSIIQALNKCKILTGTNASNGSRTRGYISLFCSQSLVGMYLCSLFFFLRPTTQDDQKRRDIRAPTGRTVYIAVGQVPYETTSKTTT